MTFIGLVASFGINIKQYGARGNGVNDDTAAIQGAINALPNSGGALFAPPGNYKLSASLTIPSAMFAGFTFIGSGWGTTLTLGNGVNDYIIKFSSSNGGMAGAYIGHMKLDCNGVNQTSGGGIDAYGSYRCKFDNLWIHNPFNQGIYLHFGPGGAFGFQNEVKSCFLEGGQFCTGDGQGLRIANADENYIHHNLFQQNGGTSGSDNCHIKDENGLNVYEGNAFVNGRSGLKLYANRGRVIGNVFDGVGGTGTDSAHGTGGSGLAGPNIQLSGSNNIVANNSFLNVGYGASPANSITGIYCPSAGNRITGNILETDGSAYNATQSLIFLDNGSNGNVVEQNKFITNTGSSGALYVQYGNTVGSTDNAVRLNTGWQTESHGSASILSGNTSVAVTHGLSQTPTIDQISVTPQTGLGSAATFWVSTVTSTQFTINVNVNPATTVTFGWRVNTGY